MITDDRWPMADGRWPMADGDRTMLRMRVFARWWALDGRAKRLSLEAASLTALAVVRVKLEGAPRLLHAPVPHGVAAAKGDGLRDLTAAAERAGRYVPGATCLSRALALQWMLKRRGVAADVRLGVRTDAGVLLAHAWVEYDGVALDDPKNAERYAVLR